jgi:predicted nucleotidyltransferase
MKLTSNDLICGIKAKLVRDFFVKHEQIRNPKRPYPTNFTALGLSTQKDILLFIEKLEKEGYYAKKTSHSKDIYWERENKALGITNVKFIKRISRTKADKILSDLLKRIKQLKEDSYYISCVTEARVFGSYLDDKAEDLGDIDIQIDLGLKPGYTYEQSTKISLERSRHKNLNFLMHICYANETEPKRFLKNRNRYLSFNSDPKETHKHKIIYKDSCEVKNTN